MEIVLIGAPVFPPRLRGDECGVWNLEMFIQTNRAKHTDPASWSFCRHNNNATEPVSR